MAHINPTLPTAGEPNSTEDLDVLAAFQAILGLVNGSLDSSNVTTGTFLRLASVADLKVAFGTASASFVDTTELSTGNIVHGLTQAPLWANAWLVGTGVYSAEMWVAGSRTRDDVNITFEVGAEFSFVSGNVAALRWVAIG